MPTPTPLVFPINGLNKNASYNRIPQGMTHYAMNVRPFDSIERRLRGGRREGLSKWIEAQVNTQPIQAMTRAVLAVPYGGNAFTPSYRVLFAHNTVGSNVQGSTFSGTGGTLTLNFNAPAARFFVGEPAIGPAASSIFTVGADDSDASTGEMIASMYDAAGQWVWSRDLGTPTSVNLENASAVVVSPGAAGTVAVMRGSASTSYFAQKEW